MKNNPHYLKVILDRDATIVEFECTLRDIKSDFSDVIGKNWFDTFIESSDKETVLKVFTDLLNNNNIEQLNTYENDIKCADGHHKLIDFHNETITKNSEKFISSFGVEHIDNIQ